MGIEESRSPPQANPPDNALAETSEGWSQPRRTEVTERWYLLALWLLCPTAFLLAVPDLDPSLHLVGWVGVGALSLLCLRLMLRGFWGYERAVGLRIIRRDQARPNTLRWLFVCAAVVVVGSALLVGFQRGWLPQDGGLGPGGGVDFLRLVLVGAVAAGTFLGLLLVLSRGFSVFGTTSIFGVVLGVAALVVVQSVATGFQHEFERRVLGVYAHINVTRSFGIAEYRRFETWLGTLPGVVGASPFAYYSMVLAPYHGRSEDRGEGDSRMASVLVKGIQPDTAAQVIDVVDHLERGSGRVIPLSELRSDHVLMPMPDRPDEQLPDVIVDIPDPRGEGWYERELERAKRLRSKEGWPVGAVPGGHRGARMAPSEWVDPPEPGAKPEEEGGHDGDLPTMFVGRTLASELGLGIGDTVLLVEPGASFDHTDAPKFMHYRIAGVFQAGFQEYDERLIYVEIKELQRFKYRDKDVVSGVDLRLSDPALSSEVGARIRRDLGDEYAVLEWQKLNENLFSSIRTQKNVITIILSLVIFVASFNVLSALWTMVVRRTPEIAIIMSMGGTGPQVARIFQVTGMTIGLAGSLAGIALGVMMCWLVELYGYTLDPEVYFIEELPVEISLVQIAWVLGMTLAICFVATIPPSLRAGRQRPVDGLRYE